MSPESVLDELRTMAPEVRDGVVLGADGRRLAGNRALAGPARKLFAHAADASEVEVQTARGTVYAARGGRRSIAVVAARSALSAVMLYDLRMMLRELEGKRR
jgi:predicted regulator of Ras-like GTPase activity (Roadblock/LC7/MglB family)